MTETSEEEKTLPHEITILKLRKWDACGSGRDWFREKFPEGGVYGDVMSALYKDKRYDDASWLASNIYADAATKEVVEGEVRSIQSAAKEDPTTGDWSHAATTGDRS
ncbi:hypothetical protein, partial [Acetobacter sp. DsW_063]|uniref:hypothetical protein n=1 Tax=Acetobacter sp. DsW_063 TaxID=1514894 RepID=UPI000B72074D